MENIIQKDFFTAKGAKLHYMLIRGKNETPLVLIHGQGMCCEDYESVFEKLSENYTIYAIDCFGHGESEKNPELYRCNTIGDSIAELIEKEIGVPCVLSGHSSGGILAPYVAGVIPQLVKGLLLEDPPFFNVQPGEFENTFVYKDGFLINHEFLKQTEEKEFLVYYLEHSYIYNYLGKMFFGNEWAHSLAEEARKKLAENPGQKLPKLEKVPEKSFHGFIYADKFDDLFSETFYTGEWFEGVDQEEILKSVKCPTVYLKAKTKYGKDGVLWAANSEGSAARVMKLLSNARRKDVRSGHDIHYEKPKKFLKAMKILEKMMKS